MEFLGLNAGPGCVFNEAVSFQICTDNQAETDRLWQAITTDGGEPGQCGWCKDRFGLSWQVTPRRLLELMKDTDQGLSGRVMQAMMRMQKINIAGLEEAASIAGKA